MLREEPNARFRRQVALREWVYDFGDFGARLLIELDGGIHELPGNALRDQKKSQAAEAAGFDLLRLTNDDVWTRPDWVLDQVRVYLKAPHPLPPPRKGEGEESV
jgi:very-short-patch-repair endonuclease